MNSDPEVVNNRPPPPRYIPPPPPQTTTTTTSSSRTNDIQLMRGERFMVKSLALNFMGEVEIQNVIPLIQLQSAYIHLTRPRDFLGRKKKHYFSYAPRNFWNQDILEIKVLKDEAIARLKRYGTYTPEAEEQIRSYADTIHIPESAWSSLMDEYARLPQEGGKRTRKNKNKTHKRR